AVRDASAARLRAAARPQRRGDRATRGPGRARARARRPREGGAMTGVLASWRLILPFLLLAACRRSAGKEDSETEAPAVAVTCKPVRAASITDRVELRGTVRP